MSERQEFCEELGVHLLDSMLIMGIEDADMSDGRVLADTVYCLGYRKVKIDEQKPCKGNNVNVCVAEGCYGEACLKLLEEKQVKEQT